MAPKLTSSEHYALASFLLETREKREATLATAIQDPKVSGSLIQCMRWLLSC